MPEHREDVANIFHPPRGWLSRDAQAPSGHDTAVCVVRKKMTTSRHEARCVVYRKTARGAWDGPRRSVDYVRSRHPATLCVVCSTRPAMTRPPLRINAPLHLHLYRCGDNPNNPEWGVGAITGETPDNRSWRCLHSAHCQLCQVSGECSQRATSVSTVLDYSSCASQRERPDRGKAI